MSDQESPLWLVAGFIVLALVGLSQQEALGTLQSLADLPIVLASADSIRAFVEHPPASLSLWVATWLGSVAGQLLSLSGSFGNFRPFLRRMLPNRTKVVYDRLDCLLSITVLPLLSYLVVSPETVQGAAAAGLAGIVLIKRMAGPGSDVVGSH